MKEIERNNVVNIADNLLTAFSLLFLGRKNAVCFDTACFIFQKIVWNFLTSIERCHL